MVHYTSQEQNILFHCVCFSSPVLMYIHVYMYIAAFMVNEVDISTYNCKFISSCTIMYVRMYRVMTFIVEPICIRTEREVILPGEKDFHAQL